MKYRIGLNIGVSYIGWAIVECSDSGEPFRIERTGVRMFDAAEMPKTGESLATPRREARALRRRVRRMKHRKERVKLLLEKNRIIQVDSFMERYHKAKILNVFQLRYEALERVLINEELAQILIYLVKHRGFKSSRKSEYNEKENGKVLEATRNNKFRMQENNYRTVGEMIYKDSLFHVKTATGRTLLVTRNKDGDYKKSILRELLVAEIKTIFQVQRKLGNPVTTKELEEKYLDIFSSQRSFDQGPGNQPDGTPSPYAGDLIEKMVGRCSLEPDKKRASMATFSAEYFILLQKVNKLRIIDDMGSIRSLEMEERKKIIELAFLQKDVKYSTVRKKLGLNSKERFKKVQFTRISEEQALSSESKTIFISLEWFHEYKKIFSELEEFENKLDQTIIIKLDRIGTILSLYKGDEKRVQELSKLNLEKKQIDELIALNPSKYYFLSLDALKKVIPFAEMGLHYNEVCNRAGYNSKASSKYKKKLLVERELRELIMREITSPVVKRSVSQTIKVLNAIIREYGSPVGLQITCAKGLTRNFKERVKSEKIRKEHQKENEEIKKLLSESGILKPTGQDIIKYHLWKQQKEICLYSGEKITFNDLFDTEKVEVDHIIPYSISFDDSYRNKVLVKTEHNRKKGDQIPFSYLGNNAEKWEEFEQRVNCLVEDHIKKQFLLMKKLDIEEKEESIQKGLTDTRYIAKLFYKVLSNSILFAPIEAKTIKQKFLFKKNNDCVLTLNESVVTYLSNRWSISGIDQESDKQYALKAMVVACCTEYMLYKVALNIQSKEIAYRDDLILMDKIQDKVIKRGRFTQAEWQDRYPKPIPKPWMWFREEVELHMMENPEEHLHSLKGVTNNLSSSIKPIFVSYMSSRKVTGAGHADTIRSPRHFMEDGIVISKTDIRNLRLNRSGEIEGYYNPTSDRLLYEALKSRLREYGGIGDKAFQEPFYKPRSDGSKGPIVKKVKLCKKLTLGVIVNEGKGIAENANGSIVRIDIFLENGKYYFVPIYTSDFKKSKLPNKVATANRQYYDWKTIPEENFVFSLYQKDVIKIKNPKGVRTRNNYGELVRKEECMGYFITADISSASIRARAHDNSFEFRGVGIQSLEYIKKFQVDILGNLSEIKKEKRLGCLIHQK